jgi:hypothetical protein
LVDSAADMLATMRQKELAKGGEADPYARYTLGELLVANLPEPGPLVDGVIPMGSTAVIGGQHKVGKTIMLSQLGLSVAGGVPWLGYETRPQAVLYLNYEVAAWSFKRRIVKQFAGLQRQGVVDEATLQRIRDNFISESLPRMRVNVRSDLIELGEYAQRRGVGLVIVDPIRGAFMGDRNKDEVVDRVMQDILDHVVKPSGASVIMGHHLRKPPSGEEVTGSTWDLKGSSGFADAADAIMTMRRDKSDPSVVYVSFTLRHYESPDDMALTLKPASMMWVESDHKPSDWRTLHELFEVKDGKPGRFDVPLTEVLEALGISRSTFDRKRDTLPITISGKIDRGQKLYSWSDHMD